MQALSRALALKHFRAVETSSLVAGVVASVVRENVAAVDMAVFAAPVAVNLASFTGVDSCGFRNCF
jgi:hypothetical protein